MGNLPQVGVKITNIWNHRLGIKGIFGEKFPYKKLHHFLVWGPIFRWRLACVTVQQPMASE